MDSIYSLVYSLELRLEELEQSAAADVASMRRAVQQLHPMAHGPEDRNWCWTCNVQFPCPTSQVVGYV